MHSRRLPSVCLLPFLTASVLGLAPAASAQNVFSNPGFESGSLSPWQDEFIGSGGRQFILWHTTTDFVHSGQHAVVGAGLVHLSQTFAPITPQSITQFSFWATSPDFKTLSSGFGVSVTYNSPTQGEIKTYLSRGFFPTHNTSSMTSLRN